ncbi:PncB Nicotinic acid phosphoribosyltransferase [Pyrenophora tritici-repentis]|uniref:nicotinate phosphoribosyltransferase n=2 Tax=Pyrenophora tritici-repentis TaxID=45151 RepID=A0A2W1HJ34_9PLEO|nr:nicotinate phosphoribosyltransferase [Pyrenophora tritici-repentis Pt-1C-BFP]KAA8615028.1 Nicotinate phosphoribosyltransferase [Pyrenophora tritici-repentis]EDU50354.1 nicotinate phosphoribosyltransferase [Pyrenophora tritici-repentis Pt-1C-BFP]KAF7444850.1 Nicotinate phosphoribosyltransferase [Pyrenophora tritici-repentis]KAF7564485.1 PncB, Nicotinic acid phosphoribosyltransferase [Pyrenophora tritici-repentis]KAG9379088.1 Nicotinate phosphoribosyltransferase [Pyrenophora tritici-repentis]
MAAPANLPEGIISLLDTDLYKLTMQCCILKFFPDVSVTYSFTNRTPDKKLSRAAFKWLQAQVDKLENVAVSDEELKFLKDNCPYLNAQYLHFLSTFRLKPSKQLKLSFEPASDTGSDSDQGDFYIHTEGLWLDTILYEIPLLALVSEAYFKFVETDWSHQGQVEKAYEKGRALLEKGCIFSEFGSRRRRDYHTQDLVLQGLRRAVDEGTKAGWKGKLSGTSNVHFAMKHGLVPIGTVAHEWFMGVAAITNSYENANEIALEYWTATFGAGVLSIALTDTFGTPAFLQAFKKQIPRITTAIPGGGTTLASAGNTTTSDAVESLSSTKAPIQAPYDGDKGPQQTYAQVFTGVRQDSGDPLEFIRMMREFYDQEGIKEKKTIVFSDSLNIELCFKYKKAAEEQGFQPTFGVGTFLTNDFVETSTGSKSVPLNIVIKIASAAGRHAVKISDNVGKNTGDQATVNEVKQRLGYQEKSWVGGDEKTRWGNADQTAT